MIKATWMPVAVASLVGFFSLPHRVCAIDLGGGVGRARFVDRVGDDKDRASVRVVRSAAIDVPLPDPTMNPSAVRLFSEASGIRTFTLEPARWSSTRNGFRYDDPAMQSGVRRIVLRTGKNGGFLVLRAGGAVFGASAIHGPTGFVEVQLQIGPEQYCGRLGPPQAVVAENRPGRLFAAGELTTCEALAEPETFTGAATCVLDETSTLTLAVVTFPIPSAVEGKVELECTVDALGVNRCSCVLDLDPINILGLGDLCIWPEPSCPDALLSCQGGHPLDVDLDAARDIGACNGLAQCATMCDARCAGLGVGYTRSDSACEDFCRGGSNDGAVCAVDAECPGGECVGPEGGLEGHVCECSCEAVGLGSPAVAGSLSCGAGTRITLEQDENGICGDVAPVLMLPPTCSTLTTATASAVLGDNTVIGPLTTSGSPTSCTALAAADTGGTVLVGHRSAFGTTIGNVLVQAELVCRSGPPPTPTASPTPTDTATPAPTDTPAPPQVCCGGIGGNADICIVSVEADCGGIVGPPGSQCDATTGLCSAAPAPTGDCCQPLLGDPVDCLIGPGIPAGICTFNGAAIVIPGTTCLPGGCGAP